MRFFMVAILLLLPMGAMANEIANKILKMQIRPQLVVPCIEKTTQEQGLCGYFEGKDDTVYLAFRNRKGIKWVKHITKEGELLNEYTPGEDV